MSLVRQGLQNPIRPCTSPSQEDRLSLVVDKWEERAIITSDLQKSLLLRTSAGSLMLPIALGNMGVKKLNFSCQVFLDLHTLFKNNITFFSKKKKSWGSPKLLLLMKQKIIYSH